MGFIPPPMRNLFLVLILVAGVEAVRAADAAPYTPPADAKGDWSFTPDPTLPNVLLIGDSISIGYTRLVRAKLAGKANVFRPMRAQGPDNCGDTSIGLERIDLWLGERKWDVIHFNWGLWDLCYRNPASKNQGNRDKAGGKLSTPLDAYERNLEKLVARLKTTGARLVWASTTLVPEGEAGRFVGDDEKYNAVAARVMQRHGIPTNDLFALTRSFAGQHFIREGDVHFTSQGYARLAGQVASAIESIIGAKGGR